MQTHRHRQAGETGIGLPKAHYNLQSGIPKCLLDWMTDRDHIRLPRIEPTRSLEMAASLRGLLPSKQTSLAQHVNFLHEMGLPYDCRLTKRGKD